MNVFVARERELEQLEQYLDRAMAGQGQVCFVVGEAGSGKTSLVTEFARRAQEQHAELVVAAGQADAQTGAGDPYLPFREVLGLLTGDVETKFGQGAITKENATRLLKILEVSGEALVECGADLIGAFVPGAGLALRAGMFVAEKAGWLDKLKQREVPVLLSTAPANGGIEQSHVLEQYTNVMRALARNRLLLLVLDDLQWADSASIGLLFRLGRRIGDSQILIVGTYRPEEVALGRAGERHPLQKVLAEFKRYLGDVWIDLDRAREAEGRWFVDALLGSELCRLSGDFGAALYRRTGGHPLFTVELLRHMQEQGVLVRDQEDCWIEGAPVNWDVLPTRIEGVIEERIARLQEELRQTLTIASVEGESFTAQVIARVQEIGERDLVHRLARELDNRHHLVQEQGIARVHEQRLSLYRFRHNLFQSYLYNELGQAERAWLHEDVGYVLEALYGDQVDEIAVQLAYHFEAAGIKKKARHYLQRAGEQACRRYAYDEAVAYLDRALDLTPGTEHAIRYALLLTREQAHETRGARSAQSADLTDLEALAEALEDGERKAEVALRQARYAEATSDYAASIAAAQRVAELAREIDDRRVADGLLAEAYLVWGTALWRQGQFDPARACLEQALPLFRRLEAVQQMAKVLRVRGNVYLYQGRFAEALEDYRQALGLYRECGDRRGQGGSLNNLAIALGSLGQYDQTAAHLRQALEVTREVGDRRSEARMLVNLGVLSSILGQLEQARRYDEDALQITQEIGDRQGEGLAQRNLGYSFHDLGEYVQSRACQELGLAIAREVGDRRGEASALAYLGETAYATGEYARAEARFQQSLAVLRELGTEHCAAEARAWLAQVALAQGDLGRAREYVAELLPYLDRDPAVDEGEIVLRVFLVCARVLRAAADSRAAHLLSQAHGLLQEQADKIRDQSLRRSFLENVAMHREIVDEFAREQELAGLQVVGLGSAHPHLDGIGGQG